MADVIALHPGDTTLRERARAPVEEAVRGHFASLGRMADEATLREVSGIVLRGLTPTTLARIASSGLSSTDLIRTLIPQPAQTDASRPFNWSAITPAEIARLGALGLLEAQHVRAALGAQGADDGARSDGAGASGYSSSFHNDDAYLRSPAGMAMQSVARECGLGWAANRADVLRLGEDAIRLFARTQFRRESFDGLRQAGFEARDAVHVARFAERTGQDANRVAETTADSIRIFGGDSPQERERWRKLMADFYAHPENAERREALDKALTEMETRGTPRQQEQARRQREVEERMRHAGARAEQEAAERLAAQRREEQAAAERLVAQRREGQAAAERTSADSRQRHAGSSEFTFGLDEPTAPAGQSPRPPASQPAPL